MARAAGKTTKKRDTSLTPAKLETTLRLLLPSILEDLGVVRTDAQMEAMVHAAAKSAVKETLITLGLDTAQPIEAQNTFSTMRKLVTLFNDENFQADLDHLKYWRQTVEKTRSRVWYAMVTTFATGAIGMFIVGFKGWLGK